MSWDASHCSGIASVAIVEEVDRHPQQVWSGLIWILCGGSHVESWFVLIQVSIDPGWQAWELPRLPACLPRLPACFACLPACLACDLRPALCVTRESKFEPKCSDVNRAVKFGPSCSS